MKAINLRVEYLNNPVGVDIAKPRLSWEVISLRQNNFQTAYQILVSDNSTCSFGNVWNSGKIESAETLGVVYAGKPLEPDTKYYWIVRVWDNSNKVSSKIKPSFWLTGFLGQKWEAQWVTPQPNDIHETETSPMVRKEFVAKSIERATLFIYSYGLYELFVNGQKADERLLSTAWSDTNKKQLCDVYDITDKILNGQNCVGIWMGDGYNQNFSIYASRWTGPKRFIAQLHLHYTDGHIEKIFTDSSWKCCFNSPILFNHLYNGECYDARYEVLGWNCHGFDDSIWSSVRVLSETKKKLVIEAVPPLCITEYIKPQKYYMLENGRYIFDFGQNFAGFVKIKASGKRGNRITIRYAEEISKRKKKGKDIITLDTFTNRLAKATDVYIFKGEEIATYQPHFTYHGFRYVEIIGYFGVPEPDFVLGCVIHTDLTADGSFVCDKQLVNRIYQNARWSIRSNSMSYPTDCPVRDERTPCAMDVATYEDMATFCFDMQSYFGRWLKTTRVDVNDKSKAPMIPCWSGEQVTLAWLLYTVYGDERSLKESYPSLQKYIQSCLRNSPDMLFPGGFGDWCVPNENADYLGAYAHTQEVDTALFYWHLELAGKMAKVLNKNNDELKYLKLAKQCKEVYNKKFYDNENHFYSKGAQTPNILALKFGLVPDVEIEAVKQNLIKEITVGCGEHLSTGIFGTRHLSEVLGDMGEIELAIKCLCQKTYPGFGHQIKLGATTLWEQWKFKGEMASHNHAMFAGAGTGFFTKLAGISSMDIAFKQIQIKPCVPESINKVYCTYHTVRGIIKIEWAKKKGEFNLQVRIPTNCTAEIIMPDGSLYTTGNGNYQFNCQIDKTTLKDENVIINPINLIAINRKNK